MKKVTTNITFGQILFILLSFVFASLMFFYLGAKFGPTLLNTGEVQATLDDTILPDEGLSLEIQKLLANKKHDFVFEKVLQSKVPVTDLNPDDDAVTEMMKSLSKPENMPTPSKTAATKTDKPDTKTTTKTQDKDPKPTTTASGASVPSSESTKSMKSISPAPAPSPTPTKDVTVKKINNMQVKVAEPKVITIPKTTPAPDTIAADTDEDLDAVATPSSDQDSFIDEPKPQYSLQMGSYSDVKSAQKALSSWKARGYDAKLVTSQVTGKGTWYRIQVGGYQSATDAAKGQQTIMQKYKESSRVVTH